MPEYNENQDDEYDPSNEGPEAKQFREESQDDLRLERLIDRFLKSLTLEDLHRHLFTFEEMKTWLLMHKRVPRRPK